MVSIKFLALHIWYITSEIYLNDKLFYQWLEKNLAKIFQVGLWAFTLPYTLSNGRGLRKGEFGCCRQKKYVQNKNYSTNCKGLRE